ncbi:bifunctional lysylphosphatidylglycerol flippase/synthetase MprF [Actinomadura terrae]|uniref:bifunctional lysylphosphatidylglycerol flippase/synthetase MprF n=1 Tax=Actinomadura terrae TaxID=604353 RepID=UPI001FA73E58|nr:phosphatidylglycerol lysyltransferase domain-containing protein [Actinomadura terrae]
MPDPADRPLRPLAAATASVAALVAVPATSAPRWLDRLSLLATGRPLAPAHAAVLALVLALVARGVLLRRRAAWYALLALVTTGLLAVLTGEDAAWRLPLLVAAGAALWTLRDRFTVRPHPERVRAAVRTGASLTLAATAATVLLGGVSIRSAGRDVATGLGATGAPIDGASWLPGVLGVTGAVGLLVLVGMLLAPVPAPPPGDESERALVAGLVARSGSDTLAPFALRRDKAYVFSPDGRAAIGYRVMFGMAVAGGDPVGDPGSREAAVRAFLALCRRTGWRPAVLGAGTALLPAWAPLRSFGYGDEVVVRPSEFTLSGRSMRNVRQAVARTVNAGVTSEIVAERDLSPDLRAALLDVASRSLGGAAERGFSMNLDELLTGHHPGALVAIAYGPDGTPIAFQRYVISGRSISLDAMRRAPDGPNGVNERLIVETIEYASAHDLSPVSLNFAAFRALLDSRDRSVPERLGYQALHLLDPLIAVESLYLFDKKFRPAYEPRSIVFRSWLDIGRLAAALLTLEFARSRPTPVPESATTEPAHHLGRP